MMAKWNFLTRKEAPTSSDEIVAIERRGPALFARIAVKEIGTGETPEISVPIVAAIQEAGSELRFLVIEFSRVEFLNSTGLGMLVDLRDRVQASNGIVVLFGVRDNVLQIFKTVSVDRMFTIVNSVEALKKALR